MDGTYHMFLTVVPGTFSDWNAERHIQHLTSKDLLHWTTLGDVNLETTGRSMHACSGCRMGTGGFGTRMNVMVPRSIYSDSTDWSIGLQGYCGEDAR